MLVKIFAKKIGMTQIYDDASRHIAATVLEIVDAIVVGKKTIEKDGYSAAILGKKSVKGSKKKSFIGQLKGIENVSRLIESRQADGEDLNVKDTIGIANLSEGDVVLVKAVSKGKGFAGTVKRHGFTTGPKTHGSNNYRQPGSIGPTYPQRVIKGRKMAGKMGYENAMVKGVKVLRVDTDSNRIMVKGPIPGPNRGSVVLEK